MSLCEFCVALDVGALIEKTCENTDFKSENYNVYGSQAFFTHRTRHDLRRYALGDCILCRLFWTAFSQSGDVCDDELAGAGEGLCALPIKIRLKVDQCHEDYAPVRASCFALEIQKPHHEEDLFANETWSVFSVEAPDARNPYLMPARPSTSLRGELWRGWIADCQLTHYECDHTTSYSMPTRLLRIDREMETITLLEVSSLRVEYVALSYCWGHRASITTTSGNYALRLAGMKWLDLPLTFRDAVEVTCTLGYEYLWIDSLCIIQDSKRDWQQECSRMQHVYSGAALTLAADQAEDPYSGLLSTVETDVEQRCEVAVSWPSTMNAGSVILKGPYKRHNKFTDHYGPSGLLHTRAWAVQERLLSSRVLHLRGWRSHFECNAGRRLDLLPHLLPLEHPLDHLHDLGSHKGVLRPACEVGRHEWYILVSYYADCNLTYARDRLPALSGLARAFEKTFGCRYLAGIWENDFALGLAWSTFTNETLSLQPAVNAGPTWSWASCDKPIHYHRAANAVDRRVWEHRCDLREMLSQSTDHDTWFPCLDLVTADLVTSGEDRFAEVSMGRLSLRGRGRPFRIGDLAKGRNRPKMHFIFFNANDVSIPRERQEWYPSIELDQPQESPSERGELLCLVLGIMWSARRPSDRVWYGLGLQPVPNQARTYERVGMISMSHLLEETDQAWDSLLEWLLAGDLGEIHLV